MPHVRLPAEWEPVGAVLMAWPRSAGDWAPHLGPARATVGAIARAIAPHAQVIMLSDEPASLAALVDELTPRLTVIELKTNDTWTRDYGPITVLVEGSPQLLDFGFNGWGLKFPADLDNQVTTRLADQGVFGQTPIVRPGLWLEGGSIESDGAGTLLTTRHCLLSPNRNPHLTRASIETQLARWLGIRRTLWLEQGPLEGDDTDGHIDTLARLCPDSTIAYVDCDDPRDAHYPAFKTMRAQLESFRTVAGGNYRLVPLPWPRERVAADGHRLPVTYANFLVVNEAVLAPTYDDPPTDARALEALSVAFPHHEIIGIDCRALVEQHGSLHCMTMQIPRQVFA
ncbi:MAG: agmatine deiminase family protein [Myxococcales bacterium FL481]|nr:MAG: agmatine deiminase family protein [Myxococcales bacterium FL481]